MMLVMIYYPAGFAGFFDWAKAKAVNLWTALVKDKRPAES
jgi:hypothetical protein